MKKTLLAFSALSFLVIGSAKAQTYYMPLQDFNGVTAPALPANWASNGASIWKSGAPNTLMPMLDDILLISANLPDYMAAVGIDGSIAANDGAMLVTPTMSIPAGATSAAISFDEAFYGIGTATANVEKFQLFSSIDGGANWVLVSNIPANTQYIWTPRVISIGLLAGQTNVKFGFKYTRSTAANASIGAALDNIKVWMFTDSKLYSAGTGDPVLDGKTYAVVGTTPSISGYVQNLGTAATSAAVYYQVGANAAVGPVATNPASINTLGAGTYTTATLPAVTAGNTTVKVWAMTANDGDHTNDTLTLTIAGVTPDMVVPKKVVFEEGTGTWCGWCPRGTVNMEKFANDHPGVVAQVAVHNEDPMTVTAYDSYIRTFISGFPSIVVDRRLVDDPGSVSALYTSNKDKFGFADVTMTTPVVTGTNVSVDVTVKPKIDIPNPKMALVITESNIQSPSGTTAADSQWYQHNYYAGGGQGAMGGFETKGEWAVGTVFHFVGRSITNPTGATMPAGEKPAAWPATLLAGQTYTATMTATLSSGWNASNLQYIALLNDGTGEITLNSAFSTLPTLKPTFPPTAIANVEAGISNAFIYPNPSIDNAFLQVDLKDATTGSIVIVDATGRTISTKDAVKLNNGKNVIEIPTASLSNGLYFVNLNTPNGNISLKFQVVK